MIQQEISAKIATFFARYPRYLYEKQEIIIRAGETPKYVFYIIEGRVSQYDISPNGNEVVVNAFKPGAFFPMSSIINDTPNAYFFEASTNVEARKAPGADVIEFLRNNPDVTFDLLSRVYRGVDGVLRRMAHLMGGDADSRVLFELLSAAQRFGQQNPDDTVSVPFREGELSKYSGLARETVSRCLQGLKAKGLVVITREGIIISSVARLEALLGAGL